MHITDEDIKKICSSTVCSRAAEYFEKGRVHIKKREENILTASVDDDRMYNTRIDFAEGKIKDVFCTCAYYETMNSPCKHIAATLMQRSAELNNIPVKNENEQICKKFCDSFITEPDLPKLPVHFEIHINSASADMCTYSVCIKLAERTVQNIAGFLECYAGNEFWDYRKKRLGDVPHYYVSDNDKAALDVLSEYVLNIKAMNVPCQNSILNLGALTFKRLFFAVENCSHTIIFNRITMGNIPFLYENPDILIDINAVSDEINLYAGSYGNAIVPDGSIFYYENNIYITDKEWQNWFMPIYNSLAPDCRTQLTFTKKNAVSFAKNVLPVLRNKPGIITSGLEHSVVNAPPDFALYLDSTPECITCVVKVTYGDISFTLPYNEEIDSKIVVRDKNAEEYVLWQLSDFVYSDGKYRLYDDELIFTFISKLLPQLQNDAVLYMSSAFEDILPKTHNFKHNISYNQKIDLLESDIESDLTQEEILGILKAVELKEAFYKLKNGEYFDIEAGYDELSVIKNLYSDISEDGEKLKIKQFGLMYLTGIADSFPGVSLQKSAQSFIEKLRNIKADIPKYLQGILREYQKDGINWIKRLSSMGLGGILADDMGLGKTLQVIAYICSESPDKPALIVCPSSLTYNWFSEIKKFTPDAKALIIDGTVTMRKALIDRVNEYDFIITSYALLRRDIEDYENILFSYCITDEAQNIKNPKSMNAKSVKAIKAERKFALTGTPVENSLGELWSIFDFCATGYLGTYPEFKREYETPVLSGIDGANTALRKKINPFIMRRMKSQVLDELPEKIENTIFINMTEEQTRLYHSFRSLAKKRALSIIENDDKNKHMEILTLLLRLRQICCHPSVFDKAYTYGSGKLDLLSELIENTMAAGHRILIFSQFTSMLEIIRATLKEQGISCFYLDGSTPSQKRTEYVNRFNSGEKSVFLISLKAGGTGLNLTGADTVIHFDPWWNPAVTDQASDRAYRIGQKKSVQIIKLAAKNTIEEKILRLQEQKRAIANDIITVENNLKNMSAEEILELFE